MEIRLSGKLLSRARRLGLEASDAHARFAAALAELAADVVPTVLGAIVRGAGHDGMFEVVGVRVRPAGEDLAVVLVGYRPTDGEEVEIAQQDVTVLRDPPGDGVVPTWGRSDLPAPK